MDCADVVFSGHAIRRMFERGNELMVVRSASEAE